MPNQVLVKFAEGTSDSVIAAYVRAVQGRVSAEMEALGVVVLDVPRGKVAGVVADLQRLAYEHLGFTYPETVQPRMI